MMRLFIKTAVDAAHYLPDYPGKCANLHGHRWEIEIEIEGSVDAASGMVVDFGAVKDLIRQYDHKCFNDFIDVPTAENIALMLADKILTLADTIKRVRLRVYETPDNCVECERWRG